MKTLALAVASLALFAGVASADDSIIGANQSLRDVQKQVTMIEGRNAGFGGAITWSSTDGGTNDIYAVQRTPRLTEGRNSADTLSATAIVREANRTLGF